MMIPEFAQVIHPMAPSEFLNRYRGQSPVHFHGTPSKYDSLPKIHDLNDMLSRFVASPGTFQLRLPNGNAPIPDDDILMPIANNTWRDRIIRTQAVEEYLQAGATLTFERCESWLESAHAMCNVLSEALLARVYAGLFLVYVPGAPGRMHWDNRDMFICQLAGSKKWPVYRPVWENPIMSRRPLKVKWKESDLELIEEFTLKQGDALYVPRGWLHKPEATVGPSMHISFAVVSPTGADLLDWICDDLRRNSATVRADLPLTASRDRTVQFGTKLCEHVLERLSINSLEQYYENYRSEMQQRPLLLPDFNVARESESEADLIPSA